MVKMNKWQLIGMSVGMFSTMAFAVMWGSPAHAATQFDAFLGASTTQQIGLQNCVANISTLSYSSHTFTLYTGSSTETLSDVLSKTGGNIALSPSINSYSPTQICTNDLFVSANNLGDTGYALDGSQEPYGLYGSLPDGTYYWGFVIDTTVEAYLSFTVSGGVVSGLNPRTSTDTTRSNIWNVSPSSGNVVSSTSPATIDLSAIGYVKDWTQGTKIHFSYQTTESLVNCQGVSPTLCATTYDLPIDPLAQTGSSDTRNFAFSVSTTTTLTTEGDYQLTTDLYKPYTLLGITLWNQLEDATTTYFTLVAPNSFDTQYRLTLPSGSFGSTTATTTANDCSLFKLGDCVMLLFWPDPQAIAFQDMKNLKDTIMRKPPFGYFSLIGSEFGNLSTTTASTTPVGITTIATILSPLRTALSLILWLLLALWTFNRLRKFDFQA